MKQNLETLTTTIKITTGWSAKWVHSLWIKEGSGRSSRVVDHRAAQRPLAPSWGGWGGKPNVTVRLKRNEWCYFMFLFPTHASRLTPFWLESSPSPDAASTLSFLWLYSYLLRRRWREHSVHPAPSLHSELLCPEGLVWWCTQCWPVLRGEWRWSVPREGCA